MKKVIYQGSWPDSWKYSYPFDLLEIYGDLSCPEYTYAYANRRQQTLELVQKVAEPGSKVLDIAAAQGNFSLSLAEMGYDVTWNDLREELIGYVKLKWESGNIQYQPGNFFELNFDGQFDVVLATEVIEHVAHPDEFLAKLAQFLKPNGYIIITTPNGEYFRNKLPKFSDCSDPSQYEAIQFKPDADGHIFLLHLDEIKDLSGRAELSVKELKLVTNSLTNGHIKLHHLLKILPKVVVDSIENLTRDMSLSIQRRIHTTTIVLLSRY
jgi:2-polyprenyl-3-methyl-5-hydroxy-6-metoxy-1,4-benzoquinol methylase